MMAALAQDLSENQASTTFTHFPKFCYRCQKPSVQAWSKKPSIRVKKAEILTSDDIGCGTDASPVRDEIRDFAAPNAGKISQPSVLLTLNLKSLNVILQFRVMEMKPGRPNGSWSAWKF